MKCRCYFCIYNKPHSAKHELWEYGDRLLVAESLDPSDRMPTRTCVTCGHTEDK